MKRLYKNNADKKICGVCSGVADFLGIDPTIVRVVWGVAALCGVGIVAYFICAVIMPNG